MPTVICACCHLLARRGEGEGELKEDKEKEKDEKSSGVGLTGRGWLTLFGSGKNAKYIYTYIYTKAH